MEQGDPAYTEGTPLHHTGVCMLCVCKHLAPLAELSDFDPTQQTEEQKQMVVAAFKKAIRGGMWPFDAAKKIDGPNAKKHWMTHKDGESECATAWHQYLAKASELKPAQNLFTMSKGMTKAGTPFTQAESDLVDLAFVRLVVESETTFLLTLGQLSQMQELFDALSRRHHVLGVAAHGEPEDQGSAARTG